MSGRTLKNTRLHGSCTCKVSNWVHQNLCSASQGPTVKGYFPDLIEIQLNFMQTSIYRFPSYLSTYLAGKTKQLIDS